MKFSINEFCRTDSKYINALGNIFNLLTSLFLLGAIVLLLVYIAYSIYVLFIGVASLSFVHFVHNTVFIIVLVKVYKILLSYFKTHHISIRYIVEISIIAPAIEVVLANKMYDKFTIILLSVYGIVNLIIYLIFHEKISKMH